MASIADRVIEPIEEMKEVKERVQSSLVPPKVLSQTILPYY